MTDDILHEPRVLYYFRHINTIDLDVAITTGDGWKMSLLPDVEWVRKLLKKKNLSSVDIERIGNVENDNLVRVTGGMCCVPDCPEESDGVDRGRPLCDHHWEDQSRITERMAERYYNPPEVDLSDKDPYELLFG